MVPQALILGQRFPDLVVRCACDGHRFRGRPTAEELRRDFHPGPADRFAP